MIGEPFIPDVITVHLGAPTAKAENVTVTFPEYIKNVASSEIFPTWPESALRANIYAQISFALNRVYTEYYRNQGYDFDITNSTAFDQAFVKNRNYFEEITTIVDEIFNNYVRRWEHIEPLFTQYCNGTTVTCDGLSQWGSYTLATEGLIPYDILTTYYGEDLDIVNDAPIGVNTPSYPGTDIRFGDIGTEIREKQIQLNRISRNYPAIPKIYPINGLFGVETVDAVKEFQRIFSLDETGVIDKATWYRIGYIYTAVKRLSELDSEGIRIEEISQQFPGSFEIGDSSNAARTVQYYLAVIGQFYETVPFFTATGVFDEDTQIALIAFQEAFGLTPDGIVNLATWQALNNAYEGIVAETPQLEGGVALFPGESLKLGSQGEAVRQIQEYLAYISLSFPSIPTVTPTGVFGNQTLAAVKAYEQEFGLEVDGFIGPATWDSIARTYADLKLGFDRQAEQYPGYVLEMQEEEAP